MWAVALLAACVVAGAHASIVSVESIPQEVVDTATGAITTRDLRVMNIAGGSDFFSDYVRIGDKFYIVEHHPPVYPYTAEAKGTVPAVSQVSVSIVCPVDNPEDINGTATETISVGGRRLLSFWSALSSAVVGVVDVAGRTTVGVACAAASVVGGGCGGGSSNAVDQAQIDNLKAELDMLKNTKSWAADVTAVVVNQDRINTNYNSTLIAHQKALEGLSDALNTTSYQVDALARNIDELAADTQAGYAKLSDAVATVAVSSNLYADSRVGQLQEWAVTNMRGIINHTDSVANATNFNVRTVATRLDRVELLARKIETNLYVGGAGLNVQVDRALRALLWAKLIAIEATGLIRLVHPASPGQAPLDSLTDAQLTVFVDNLLVNLVNTTSGGVRRAHQYGVNLKCNVGSLFDEVVIGATWKEFLAAVGPIGCVNTSIRAGADPVRYCNCWFEISHSECSPAPSFTWESITSTTDRSAYQLRSALCQSTAPTTSNWHGRKIDSIAEWHAFLSQLSNTTVVPTTAFQVVSTRAGVILVTPDYSDAVVSVNLDTLFRSGTVQSATLPGVIYGRYTMSFRTMSSEARIYENSRFGIRPNFVTTQMLPFMTLSNGRSYTCWMSGITVMSTTTAVTYRVQPQQPVPLITWKVYDSEPTCTVDHVCTSTGTLLETHTTSSVFSTDVGALGRLPTAETVLVGELKPSAMTSVYDVCTACVSVDPSHTARQNKVGYLRWNFPVGYDITATSVNPASGDLADWVAQNSGNIFDHFAVENAGDYLRTVSQGRCTTVPGVEDNAICSLLDEFVVVQPTAMRTQGLLYLSPRTYSYTAQIPIDVGELAVRVYSGCPDFYFESTDVGTYFTMINNIGGLPTTVRVQRPNTDVDCTPLGDIEVQLQPRQQYRTEIPACGNFTAVVSRPGTGVGEWLSCGDPITLSIDRAFQSPVVSTGLNVSTVFIEDVAASQAAAVSQFVTEQLAVFISYAVPSLSPDLTDLNRSALANDTLTNILLGLQLLKDGFLSDRTSAVDTIANMTILVRRILDTQVADAIATAADLINENQANLILQANLTAKLVNDTATLLASIDVVVGTHEALIAALENRMSDAECKFSLTNLGGWLGCILSKLGNFVASLIPIAAVGGGAYLLWRSGAVGKCLKSNNRGYEQVAPPPPTAYAAPYGTPVPMYGAPAPPPPMAFGAPVAPSYSYPPAAPGAAAYTGTGMTAERAASIARMTAAMRGS